MASWTSSRASRVVQAMVLAAVVISVVQLIPARHVGGGPSGLARLSYLAPLGSSSSGPCPPTGAFSSVSEAALAKTAAQETQVGGVCDRATLLSFLSFLLRGALEAEGCVSAPPPPPLLHPHSQPTAVLAQPTSRFSPLPSSPLRRDAGSAPPHSLIRLFLIDLSPFSLPSFPF